MQRGIEPEKNIIVSHVSSCKHKTGKEKLGTKEARERYSQVVARNDKPVGETLPMEQCVYRVKVLKSSWHAAVPLTKLDFFRDLLEENSYRLSDRRLMADLSGAVHGSKHYKIVRRAVFT